MAQLADFEELKALAERDPEALEAYRRAACAAYIASIPRTHQERLRAVQHRVEMTLSRAPTPMAGLVRLSGMMHESFAELSERLLDLGRTDLMTTDETQPSPDNVVPLRRR